MKDWNWELFAVIICITTIGTLMNDSIETICNALLIGVTIGFVIGLPMAYFTK